MQDTIFQVNDEPYCLWDPDLKARNHEFLKGLDSDFFEYNFTVHLEAEDDIRSSVALRLSLHHSLETLFSILGAYVQAPDCAYAWLAKCSTPALRLLVERINQKQPNIFTKLNVDSINWETIANSIFHSYKPNTEQNAETVKHFATLWSRLANELNNPVHIDEYNALKHGFRVQNGGFAISIGKEPSLGVAAPEDDMQLLGKSEYGSSFFTVTPLSTTVKTRSLRISRTSVNWSVERVILLNQLTQISINNVVTALRVINGWSPTECKFLTPESSDDFDKPWHFSPGVTNMKWGHVTDETNAMLLTKEEILQKLALYQQG